MRAFKRLRTIQQISSKHFDLVCQSCRLRSQYESAISDSSLLTELDHKLEKIQEQQAKVFRLMCHRIAMEICDTIRLGVYCGKHWAGILNPEEHVRNEFQAFGGIRVKWNEISDSPMFEDYPTLDLFLEAPAHSGVNFQPREIEQFFEFAKSEIDFTNGIYRIVGKYESMFCHVNICTAVRVPLGVYDHEFFVRYGKERSIIKLPGDDE